MAIRPRGLQHKLLHNKWTYQIEPGHGNQTEMSTQGKLLHNNWTHTMAPGHGKCSERFTEDQLLHSYWTYMAPEHRNCTNEN